MNGKIGIARFLCALGLGIWLGGLVFAGVCAATLFRIARENGVEAVAPQMFGVMLQRFQFIAGFCGVLALLGWVLDRPLASRARQLWNAQGILTALMLGVTLYMGLVMFPRMNTLQREFLPQLKVAAGTKPRSLDLPKPQPGDPIRAEFDGLHHLSTRLVFGVMVMGLLALGAFAGRTVQGETERAEQRVRVGREEFVAV